MECPKCGYVMDAFTEECPRCKRYSSPYDTKQKPQPVKDVAPRKTQYRCQQCGKELSAGILDCPECSPQVNNRKSIISSDTPNPALEHIEPPQGNSRLLKVGIVVGCLLVIIGFAIMYGIRNNPPPQGSLQGQVFIVTKGRENIKLGLVTVNMYNFDDISSYLAKRKIEYKELVDEETQKLRSATAAQDGAPIGSLTKAIEENEQATSGAFFFENLPPSIHTTQTDADGKFSLQLPVDGQYVIAAQSQRDVGSSEEYLHGHTEYYYWMIQVSLDGASSKSIMLSNDNLSNANSPDSLIHSLY